MLACACVIDSFSTYTSYAARTDYADAFLEFVFPAHTAPDNATQCLTLFTIDNSITDGDRNLSLLVIAQNERVLSSPAEIIIVDDERMCDNNTCTVSMHALTARSICFNQT